MKYFQGLYHQGFNKFNMSNNTCIVLAAICFALFQNLAFWGKLTNLVNLKTVHGVLLFVSIFVFLFSVISFVFSLLCWKNTTKFILIFCLLSSAATNYYALTYGIYMDKVMIANLVQTTAFEAGDLITVKFIMWMLVFGIFPSILVWKIKIKPYASWWKSLLHKAILMMISIVLLLAAALPMYKDYASIGRNNKDLVKLITPHNYLNGLFSYTKQLTGKIQPLQPIGLDAKIVKPSPKKNIFIMVLGETSRAQNFSLNGYERETNPHLKQYNDLINFEHVSSCGTATAISVPCLYSNMARHEYSARKAEYQENVLDIIQRTGIHVYWRENDAGCKGVCNRVPTNNVIDYIKKEQGLSEGLFYDDLLLKDLDQYIEKQTGNIMIVLHTNGSHGPEYYQRYRPELENKFTPSCDTKSIESCDEKSLINVYDNTILHVDAMLDDTIKILKKYGETHDVAMLYVSDHGESLGENGFYLHSAPYSIAPKEQTHVPMIFWANSSFYEHRNIDLACMQATAKKNDFSHDNIFHTLLKVWDIQTTEYQSGLNMFESCQNS